VTIPHPTDQPTLDVPTAGRLAYDLGRAAAYAAAARGDLPTIRIGRKIRVPTAALRRQLGIDEQ
jgi:hypothetical protein